MSQEPNGKLIPRIADFGIAVVAVDNVVAGFKQDYTVGLSPGYAAPEIYGIYITLIIAGFKAKMDTMNIFEYKNAMCSHAIVTVC